MMLILELVQVKNKLFLNKEYTLIDRQKYYIFWYTVDFNSIGLTGNS